MRLPRLDRVAWTRNDRVAGVGRSHLPEGIPTFGVAEGSRRKRLNPYARQLCRWIAGRFEPFLLSIGGLRVAENLIGWG